MKQANANYYLIVCAGNPVRAILTGEVKELRQAAYLTSANTFSPDRSQAMRLCDADKEAMLERFPTCFACPA